MTSDEDRKQTKYGHKRREHMTHTTEPWHIHTYIYIYIYIYAFSRRFYPKRLTVHSGYTCFITMCVPWESNPQPSALLTQCSTTEPQEHYIQCSCVYTYIYTGAGHIIRISSKSWFISLIPFKKWNLYNVYIHSTQTDIFKVFISFNFDDYNWQLMKTPNSVSQKIRILLKTNTKKGFLEILANWKVWTWKVWACTALNT